MIDPRAYSDEKIEPPEPLPYVSRRAIKRVRAPLPTPETCDCCGSGAVVLTKNSEVYRGRSFGYWPFVYLCKHCGAYVGLHPGTDIPLGTLADKRLRDARKRGKAAFLEILDALDLPREQAYRWLAHKLEIPEQECHWGWFGLNRTWRASAICISELDRIAREAFEEVKRHER